MVRLPALAVPATHRLFRAETQRSVSGISGHIFRGYQSVAAAQAAFSYARSRSWTRAASATSSQTPLLSLPKPISESDEVEVNPLHDTESLDDTWYVVYSGISPGVYRSMCVSLSLMIHLTSLTCFCIQFGSAPQHRRNSWPALRVRSRAGGGI
jgi:hypothetical protein